MKWFNREEPEAIALHAVDYIHRQQEIVRMEKDTDYWLMHKTLEIVAKTASDEGAVVMARATLEVINSRNRNAGSQFVYATPRPPSDDTAKAGVDPHPR